jgi:hypothetical protein
MQQSLYCYNKDNIKLLTDPPLPLVFHSIRVGENFIFSKNTTVSIPILPFVVHYAEKSIRTETARVLMNKVLCNNIKTEIEVKISRV